MTCSGTLSVGEATARRWDVVVVGAGPAGSVAARELARRGRSVLLLDKATFPRPKVCGCCLNGSALATLTAVGLGDLPARCGAVPLHHTRLYAGGRTAEVRLPAGVALSRSALDVVLIRAAVDAGVAFLPGCPHGLGDSVAAGVRVLATGLRGEPATGSRIGGGVIDPLAPAAYRPGVIHMAVGRGGYVGAVRLEDGRLDLAAAFDAPFVKAVGGLGEAAADVLRQAGATPIPGIELLPWKGTPALTRRPAAVAGPDWLAAGDAAGYVEPFTGEGMAWALASGVAAAALAADWHPGRPAEWERYFARRLRPRQRVCRAAAAALRSPRACTVIVRLLALAPALARPVTRALNRPLLPLPAP